jgi:hypothetical protein
MSYRPAGRSAIAAFANHGFINPCDRADDQILVSTALSPATNDKTKARDAKHATIHSTILHLIKGSEPSPIANVAP